MGGGHPVRIGADRHDLGRHARERAGVLGQVEQYVLGDVLGDRDALVRRADVAREALVDARAGS